MGINMHFVYICKLNMVDLTFNICIPGKYLITGKLLFRHSCKDFLLLFCHFHVKFVPKRRKKVPAFDDDKTLFAQPLCHLWRHSKHGIHKNARQQPKIKMYLELSYLTWIAKVRAILELLITSIVRHKNKNRWVLCKDISLVLWTSEISLHKTIHMISTGDPPFNCSCYTIR